MASTATDNSRRAVVRAAVAEGFAEIMARRHPEFVWLPDSGPDSPDTPEQADDRGGES